MTAGLQDAEGGSSPRVWGRSQDPLTPDTMLRFIPTRVGTVLSNDAGSSLPRTPKYL